MPDTPALAAAKIPWPLMLFSGFLAAAGLPLYVNLPHFAASLGMSLSTIGLLMVGLRVLDFVQDPALGLLIDRFRDQRRRMAGLAILGMAVGFAATFTLQPGLAGMTVALIVLFTAYSLASILFYAQGVAIAEASGGDHHYRLAGYREAGALAGIVIASAAPSLLIGVFGETAGYAVFGAALAVAGLVIWRQSLGLWQASPKAPPQFSPTAFLRAGGGRLLTLGLVNTLPVAITSSLFLFFVQDRLQLAAWSGAFLVLFFLTAGISAPLWSGLVARHGPVRVLVPSMGLAIAAFIGAAALPEGEILGFALICALSGLTLGADMVILPALFASTLAVAQIPAGAGFGLWAFTNKLALALAAATVLPLLGAAGYVPGGANSAQALSALNLCYAILPCILKLLAIALVIRLPQEGFAS